MPMQIKLSKIYSRMLLSLPLTQIALKFSLVKKMLHICCKITLLSFYNHGKPIKRQLMGFTRYDNMQHGKNIEK